MTRTWMAGKINHNYREKNFMICMYPLKKAYWTYRHCFYICSFNVFYRQGHRQKAIKVNILISCVERFAIQLHCLKSHSINPIISIENERRGVSSKGYTDLLYGKSSAGISGLVARENRPHFLATGIRNLGWSGIFGGNWPHDTIF
jgi:hypothetical protein